MMKNRIFCQPAVAFRVLFAALICLLLLTPWALSHAEPAILFAAPTPQGSGDCSSWANACALQTALATALGGDEIWVQKGVHNPTTTTDRTISFNLKTEVSIYGGFAGTEDQLDQRDWQANLTILSGDIDHNDITDPTGVVTDTTNIVGANSYHVVMNPANNTGWIDGFTITAGQANGSLVLHQDIGGGLYSDQGGSLTVSNTVFNGNMADDGGGVYCHGFYQYSRHVIFNNVIFEGNKAVHYGGGLNNFGNFLALTHVHFIGNSAGWSGGGILTGSLNDVMTDITFSGNTATDYGGGLSIYRGILTLTNATFSNNTAFTGGGMFNQSDAPEKEIFNPTSDSANGPTLTDVTFHNNEAVLGGGLYTEFGGLTLTDVDITDNTAVYGGGMSVHSSNPSLTAVTFSNNGGDFGGGLHNHQSSPSLTNVNFTDNTGLYGAGIYNEVASDPTLTAVTFSSNQATWDGGGMYNDASSPTLTNVIFKDNGVYNGNGGGLHNINGSNPSLTNIIFAGNSANLSGGGLYNYMNSNPTLTNVTFSDNTAVHFDGGGLYSDDPYSGDHSSPTLHNTIVWGNSAGRNGDQVYNISNGITTITYSDIQDSGGSGSGWDSDLGLDGGGNVDADPLFVAAASGNLHLRYGSPAIDAGDNGAVPIGVTTDLDGKPRFVDVPTVSDTGSGTPPIVDMGAYEAGFVDVSLMKTVSPLTADPGSAITFTLSLTNSGNLTATQIIVTDTLPAHLSISSILTNGLIISDTGQVPAYVWAVQNLSPGQGGVITLTGNLAAPLAAGVYTNTASVSFALDGETAVHTTSISYTVANIAPQFSSTPVTTIAQNMLYTTTITTTDLNGDTLTITAPTLPAWLTLTDHGDGTATLSGTPTHTDIGAHPVALQVTDSSDLSSIQTFTITVIEKPRSYIYLPLLLKSAP